MQGRLRARLVCARLTTRRWGGHDRGGRFRDEVKLQAAPASPETPRVIAEVARFTDAQPTQTQATAT